MAKRKKLDAREAIDLAAVAHERIEALAYAAHRALRERCDAAKVEAEVLVSMLVDESEKLRDILCNVDGEAA